MVLIRTLLLWAGILLCANLCAEPAHTLKFATLAPQGSTWMNLIQEWADEIKAKSRGRLVFKLYAGGVAGDEPDVLRKMRYGQLHGGAFTGYGIGQTYSPARVMEVPFLFRDLGEIDAVRKQLMPQFESGFRAQGYELLGWMEVGFVRIFSKQPVLSLDDMRRARIWMWQGDRLAEAMFRASDIAPVPLSVIDVYTSLSTGLIDTVYSPPLAAIAMQWFTKTRHVTDIPITNAAGALLVTRRFFDALPTDLQHLLKHTGHAAGEHLIDATRQDNAQSLAVLEEQGLQRHADQSGFKESELLAIRDRAVQELAQTDYIPAPLYQRVVDLLQAYRKTHAGTPDKTLKEPPNRATTR